MKYDHTNCARECRITDDTGAELREVESVNTSTWALTQYETPLRVIGDEWARFTRMFEHAEITFDQFGRAAAIALRGLKP